MAPTVTALTVTPPTTPQPKRARQKPPATTPVAKWLQKQGISPFLEMANLARDADTPPNIKAQLWIQLARYCAPQLRAVEITEPVQPPGKDAVARAKQEVFGFVADE